MFGLFGRKKREEEFDEWMRLAQETRARQRARKQIFDVYFRLNRGATDDSRIISTDVVVDVLRKVIEASGLRPRSLSSSQEFATALLAFGVSNYISMNMRVEFGGLVLTSLVVLLGKFRSAQIGELISEAGEEWNRMAKDEDGLSIVSTISLEVDNYVSGHEELALDKLSKLLIFLAEHVE